MIKVRDNLYLGDYEDSKNLQNLLQHKIKTVLNVAYELDNPHFSPGMINNIKVGLIDDNIEQTNAIVLAKEMLTILLGMKGNVLVHCVMGLSRSPMIIVRALSELEDKSLLEVYEELITLVPSIKNSLFYNKIVVEEKRKQQ